MPLLLLLRHFDYFIFLLIFLIFAAAAITGHDATPLLIFSRLFYAMPMPRFFYATPPLMLFTL